ncbi:MAG: tRNA (adenosine(37)-N6)-threonylcarbamoyltransferase complex ATPase subunit type 1 TsaE [Bacteroidetes bacterium]|nr:tRNA (adenosine(37)-N6)-threonylcarbamoyltransferase complex ATPase subunit type 1 TsaE [Bacteroidota bacterium]
MQTIFLKNISELPQVSKSILDFAQDKKIFCFYGELGAGKTTLIKEICRQLGVTDSGSSPTFALVNEYQTSEGEKIFHFDLYRLKNENEIFDIGYEEYLFSGNYCFTEWPEKMEHLLPNDVIKIRIALKGGERIITIE